jgi:hypothetical protein
MDASEKMKTIKEGMRSNLHGGAKVGFSKAVEVVANAKKALRETKKI